MDQTLRETILLFVQVASLIAVIVYVVKTAETAKATLISAKATERSVQEMHASRDEELAPYMVVYFDSLNDAALFDLVIKNTGKTMAENVSIHFDPPLRSSLDDYDLSDLAVLHQAIPSFPPNYEMRVAIDNIDSRLHSKEMPLIYHVRVTFNGGVDKTTRSSDFILDLHIFHGIMETHTRSMNDLTRAIEAIPERLEALPAVFKPNHEA